MNRVVHFSFAKKEEGTHTIKCKYEKYKILTTNYLRSKKENQKKV